MVTFRRKLMAQTRSGLVPAQIKNNLTQEVVNCMFNPQEYSISKTNNWSLTPTSGQSQPTITFNSGGSQTLQLTLWFDTTPEGTDVRDFTDNLWKMMAPSDDNKDPQSG